MSNFAVRKKHVVIIGNYADYHYTESFMYDKQGNIRNLTRWDNSDIMNLLSFQYSGNQLVKVSDNGYPPISYDEKRYHDDSNDQIEFQYDQNGNLIYDSDRKICSIRYNVLNLPDTIQFSDGKQIVHVYDAEGTRLQTTYYTPKVTMTVPPFSVLISTDNLQNYNIVSYAMVGNKRYVRSGHGSWQLQDVLNPEGYTRYYTPEEHYRFYYIKDHLGNVREVYVNPDPGYKECVQRTQYYPTGLPWNEGMYPSEQPFKYNGKEFVEMHGLDEYDSEARWYYPAIMRTTTMDPLCEKYYSISPYAWCGNNPVNLVDPDGRKLNISGDLSREALSQLQSYVGKSVVLIRDDNGDVSYKETRHHISIRAKRICGIINEEAIQVNVITTSGSGTSDVDYFVGGAFLGNTVTENSSEGEVNVTATQLVNPYVLKKADTYSYSGKSIAHEITEAYQGAKISTKKKTSSPRSGIDGSVYPRAHRRATPQPPIYKKWLDKNGNETRNEEEVTHIIYYVESMSGERQTIQEVK